MSGFFVATALFTLPFLFGGFVVGGAVLVGWLLFLFRFSTALQVALFPSVEILG